MSALIALVRFAVFEFGPLAVFLILSSTLGVKAAIAGSIAAIVLDSAWRWRRGATFTRLYLVTSGLTLAFGAIDLVAATPFMLAYEAPLSNLATAAAFFVGAMGEKPMLQEVAEQRQGETYPATAEVRRFFQILTLVWAIYFLAKAALYVWLASTMPLPEAVALRSLIGGVSLGLMIALSATQGRRLFFLCRRLGLLPGPEPTPEGAA
jgi:intracellular septation protein A